mmetsp:Transcript_109914/g.154120  ORF Transcript_109914/g.154120 Transcript_109914/m.154120 type:complete len:253 (-) Transcript_109914:752-1510(-)
MPNACQSALPRRRVEHPSAANWIQARRWRHPNRAPRPAACPPRRALLAPAPQSTPPSTPAAHEGRPGPRHGVPGSDPKGRGSAPVQRGPKQPPIAGHGRKPLARSARHWMLAPPASAGPARPGPRGPGRMRRAAHRPRIATRGAELPSSNPLARHIAVPAAPLPPEPQAPCSRRPVFQAAAHPQSHHQWVGRTIRWHLRCSLAATYGRSGLGRHDARKLLPGSPRQRLRCPRTARGSSSFQLGHCFSMAGYS